MVGLFTIDSKIYNYGGILQEYALLKYIQNFTSAEIIQYDINQEINTFSISRSIFNVSPTRIVNRISRRKQKEFVFENYVLDAIQRRKAVIDKFRNEYMNFSPVINIEEIGHASKKYSHIISGSDQILNPSYNVPSYFLGFAEESTKILYAASIGREKLTCREKFVYSNYLMNLDHISVREDSARDILQKCTKKNIEIVVDPTLLISKDDWECLIDESSSYENYVFCYFLQIDERKVEAAKKLANRIGAEIITIPFLQDKNEILSSKMANYFAYDIGPCEFLSLIKNAKFILTDSFHCSLFSLLFNTKFAVFGRTAGSYNMNTRLDSLLSMFGAKDRFIEPDYVERILDKPMILNLELLKDAQKTSQKFLKKAINIS